jgi:hypothetical protein
MRRVLLAAWCCVIVLPLAAHADYRNMKNSGGTRIEFDDAEMKLDVTIQPHYRVDELSGVLPTETPVVSADCALDDALELEPFQTHLVVNGELLNQQFTYRLEGAVVSSLETEAFEDTWIRWSGDPKHIRFGHQAPPLVQMLDWCELV